MFVHIDPVRRTGDLRSDRAADQVRGRGGRAGDGGFGPLRAQNWPATWP